MGLGLKLSVLRQLPTTAQKKSCVVDLTALDLLVTPKNSECDISVDKSLLM